MSTSCRNRIDALVESVNLSDLWVALGGDKLHHGRGRGFWRDGDGFNISLDAGRGVWFDHARGEAGRHDGKRDYNKLWCECSSDATMGLKSKWPGRCERPGQKIRCERRCADGRNIGRIQCI